MTKALGLAFVGIIIGLVGSVVCGCANSNSSDNRDLSAVIKDLSNNNQPFDLSNVDTTSTDMATGCAGADLMNDANNCGRCGRSCGAGVCAQGRCPLTTIYATQPRPVGVAVDATNVYWTTYGDGTTGAVSKGILAGGVSPTVVASSLQYVGGIAVAGGQIIWAEGGATDGSGKISKSPTGSVSLGTIATGENYPISVISDGTNVYWTAYGTSTGNYLDGLIRKGTIAGTTGSTVGTATGLKGAGVLSLQATNLFFSQIGTMASSYTDGSISKVGTAGGAPSAVASNQAYPFGVATDATYVYWVNTNGAAVYKAPLAGGAAMSLANAQANPAHIAVDATGVYWTNQGTGNSTTGYTGGSVMFQAHSGSAPIAIAINQDWPVKLVLDGSYVYWCNEGTGTFANGTIMKTVK